LTIVNEFPAEKYIDEKLHRSTSGVALLLSKIPAFTAELGGGEMPETAIIQAAVTGTRNVMRWAGMLDGELEPIEGIKVVDAGFAAHRRGTPRAPEAGVVLHLVQPGDLVATGDPVAEIRDVWGRAVGDGLIHAEYDGFVLSRAPGIFFYPGEPIAHMAVRDEAPRTGPYPKTYFDE
jgi:predicted deacylase